MSSQDSSSGESESHKLPQPNDMSANKPKDPKTPVMSTPTIRRGGKSTGRKCMTPSSRRRRLLQSHKAFGSVRTSTKVSPGTIRNSARGSKPSASSDSKEVVEEMDLVPVDNSQIKFKSEAEIISNTRGDCLFLMFMSLLQNTLLFVIACWCRQ